MEPPRAYADLLPALRALAAELGGRPFFGGAAPHYGDFGLWKQADNFTLLDPAASATLGAEWAAWRLRMAALPGVAEYLRGRPGPGDPDAGYPGSIIAGMADPRRREGVPGGDGGDIGYSGQQPDGKSLRQVAHGARTAADILAQRPGAIVIEFDPSVPVELNFDGSRYVRRPATCYESLNFQYFSQYFSRLSRDPNSSRASSARARQPAAAGRGVHGYSDRLAGLGRAGR